MTLHSFWEEMLAELSGPGKFRFILQPMMAILLGVRFGISDAKAGQSPFLWRLFMETDGWSLFRHSLSDCALPLTVGFVVDSLLQKATIGVVHPLGAVLVAIVLVWVPFSIARALTGRWRRRRLRLQAV